MGLEWWDGSFEGISFENWVKHRHFHEETLKQKIRHFLFPWRAIKELRQDRQEISDIIYILKEVINDRERRWTVVG